MFADYTSSQSPAPVAVGELEHPAVLLPLVSGIPSRGISASTCERYRVYATGNPGEICCMQFSLANEITAYKFRSGGWIAASPPRKTWLAPGSVRGLFGCQLWSGIPTPVALCEGETDAMRLSEVLTDTLCLALSGNPTTDQWVRWLGFIEAARGSHPLLLAFDSDAAGLAYEKHVLAHTSGKRFALNLGGSKDVCEMLVTPTTADALLWDALPRLPSSVISGTATLDALQLKIDGGGSVYEPGLSTGYSKLDALVDLGYPGSVCLIAGMTGSGKSSFVNQLVVNMVTAHGVKALVLSLEMTDEETLPLLGSVLAGKPLVDMTNDEAIAAARPIADKVWCTRHFGYVSIPQLTEWLDIMPSLGVQMLVVDHITAAVSADSTGDGMSLGHLDGLISTIKAKCNEHRLFAFVVSQVNTQEDGTLTANSIRGSKFVATIATEGIGIKRLSDGDTQLTMLFPSRRTGRLGSLKLWYDGSRFTQQGKADLL